MARKTGGGAKTKMAEGVVSIKYVKRAKMWCKTWFEEGKQMQVWSENKPS